MKRSTFLVATQASRLIASFTVGTTFGLGCVTISNCFHNPLLKAVTYVATLASVMPISVKMAEMTESAVEDLLEPLVAEEDMLPSEDSEKLETA